MRSSKLSKVAIVLATTMATGTMFAQTDITGVLSAVDGYTGPAIAIGITVILWRLGKSVVKALARG